MPSEPKLIQKLMLHSCSNRIRNPVLNFAGRWHLYHVKNEEIRVVNCLWPRRQSDSSNPNLIFLICLFWLLNFVVLCPYLCWNKWTSLLFQFDVREDEEQQIKLTQTIELLLAAGYFRARIKGLSDFDKVLLSPVKFKLNLLLLLCILFIY